MGFGGRKIADVGGGLRKAKEECGRKEKVLRLFYYVVCCGCEFIRRAA